MAANLFANAWPGRAQVMVVESPDIGIIGVGEGSTPQLKAFFDTLGIAEADWMPACNATYKNGIAFHGWSDRPGFESYFHPFPGPLDLHTAPAFFDATRRRRHGQDVWAHPDRFFLSSRLAAERLSPIAPEHFPLGPSYGYHFDAHLVGAFLRDHAVGQGVVHLERRIVEVAVAAGSVTHLVAESGARIAGDLFVDASGFRSAIHQAALGVRFRSFGETLFNDSAVVMPTPSDPGRVATATRATALGNGWVWDIPLTSRTGNGYVYASRYCSRDEAERDLRAHLGVGDDGTVRHLFMKVGRVAESWVGNSLAIGLAQGFIEPLEATALHIVQATVEGFIRDWTAGGFTPQHRAAFNTRIAARYDGIRDYIVAHYRMNGRTDTPYWRDAAANNALSDSLKAIITCWFTGGDLAAEIAAQGIAGYYSATSWHCLFAGYGAFPRGALNAPNAGGTDMAVIDDFLRRAVLNFQ